MKESSKGGFFFVFPLLGLVFVFPARDPEADQAHNNLQDGGTGCGKPDVEHGYGNLFAHQECDRYPDEKRADDSLNHHKPCHTKAVEKADKAEQEHWSNDG